jgi:hypothetical protein
VQDLLLGGFVRIDLLLRRSKMPTDFSGLATRTGRLIVSNLWQCSSRLRKNHSSTSHWALRISYRVISRLLQRPLT